MDTTKKKQPKPKSPSAPLYSTLPSAADSVDPLTGAIKPGEENVDAMRRWGEENKL